MYECVCTQSHLIACGSSRSAPLPSAESRHTRWLFVDCCFPPTCEENFNCSPQEDHSQSLSLIFHTSAHLLHVTPSQFRPLCSATAGCLAPPPLCTSTYQSQLLSVLAPRRWNDLPVEIKTAETTFNCRLKTHLFRSCTTPNHSLAPCNFSIDWSFLWLCKPCTVPTLVYIIISHCPV